MPADAGILRDGYGTIWPSVCFTARMANDKHTPGQPPRNNREQTDSTRTSDKREPRAKVVKGDNGEDEPVPGRASPGSGSADDEPSQHRNPRPGREPNEGVPGKKRHTGSPGKE